MIDVSLLSMYFDFIIFMPYTRSFYYHILVEPAKKICPQVPQLPKYSIASSVQVL